MRVQFLGAAQTVTGSCFVIEACGRRFCVDCGMHQGNKAIEARNRDASVYDPANIDFVLLTHAHIDHSGLLPMLVKEGFTVLPYINPDLYVARACVDAGAAAVMPLGAPIGTNRGLRTKEMIGILIDELDVPIVVDAGIGRPSQACEAMEMGAAACLVNTAIASSADPVRMAAAFRAAVEAGRNAWLAGAGAVKAPGEAAEASSPLTGFLR